MSNVDIEASLQELPDVVAKCLLNWRKATLDRERLEATLYLNFKAEWENLTATELKAKVNASQERYEACLSEVSMESIYQAKNETLLSMKKLAGLRTAF
jgi:hypothetical protein